MATDRHATARAVVALSCVLGGLVIAGAMAGPADAHVLGADEVDPLDTVPAPPKAFEGLGLTEKLGAKVPLDVPFRDMAGKPVRLRDQFADDLPVLLTFNYSDCPMMCSIQLNALVAALPTLDLQPGRDFRMVTIVLDPRQSLERTVEMRAHYLAKLPPDRRELAAKGWTFLLASTVDDPSSIKAVADAVGFGYKFVPERAEYAHPAALIFLSSRGLVTRYVGGTDYPADVLRFSVISAGMSEPTTTAGFILNCFHYDSDANNYSRFGVMAIRIGGIAFLVVFVSAFGVWRLLRRHRPALPGVVRS